MKDDERDDMDDDLAADESSDQQDVDGADHHTDDEKMPPMMEQHIHDYRWHEGRRGRVISFEQATSEWRERYLSAYRDARPWHLNKLQREKIAQYIAMAGDICTSRQRQERAMQWCKKYAKKFRDDYEGDWGPA